MPIGLPRLQIFEEINGLINERIVGIVKEVTINMRDAKEVMINMRDAKKVMINMRDIPSPIAMPIDVIGKTYFSRYKDAISIDIETNIHLTNFLLYNLLHYTQF